MSTMQAQPSQPQLNVLARYVIDGEARVLVGRRIEGKVYVYDYPDDGHGRRYFVEAGFESKAELAVMVAEYRRRAERLGLCPMSKEAVARSVEGVVLA